MLKGSGRPIGRAVENLNWEQDRMINHVNCMVNKLQKQQRKGSKLSKAGGSAKYSGWVEKALHGDSCRKRPYPACVWEKTHRGGRGLGLIRTNKLGKTWTKSHNRNALVKA